MIPRLPSLHEPGPPRLWRIGYALAACFVVALAGLAALGAVALVLLHHPALPRSHVISVHDTVGVAQLVFASVAGAGALVALVVAYRRQRVSEASSAHDRTRVFNERFTAIAAQLGDAQPAVRLAGVHAMAGLADDWAENRQTCVDVLCAYLRLPYDPDPGDGAAAVDRSAYWANREVRHTIIRLITAHLHDFVPVTWQGLNFDFTGVAFDGGSFSGARFASASFRFTGAKFSSGTVDFTYANFSGGVVDFTGAQFSGGTVDFSHARFSGGEVEFSRAKFSGGMIDFNSAQFSRGLVTFGGATFSRGPLYSMGIKVSSGPASLDFTAGVGFLDAEFSGATVSFSSARFSVGPLNFYGAKFTGGEVDFRESGMWSQPPEFDWADTDLPPPGVMLPSSTPLLREPGSTDPRVP
jgi:uncharacterized protein YjbI with pentapeptide repeats